MAIGLSHGSTTVYSSSAPSKEVLVGTAEGVVFLEREADGGWRVARRALTDLHISTILVEPESGLLFVGAFHGAIHASADGGTTWERRDGGLSQDNVYSLAAVKTAGGVRLYAGTEPAHLFCSDDLGLSWTELPKLREVEGTERWTFPAPPHVAHVKHINFDPGDPSTVYAGIEQGGLLKSTDAGENWEVVTGMDDDVHRTVIHPTDGKTIFTPTGAGLYATTDGGATWEHRTTREDDGIGGYPDQMVFHPRHPETMFISAAHRNPGSWRESHFANARISRSTDGGATWAKLGGGLPDGTQGNVEAMCLEDCGDSFSVFAATTAGEVFASDDGGDRWSLIASGLAPISKGGHFRALTTA